jgi:hypothetical protein
MPATINGTSGFGGNLTGNVTGNADTSTASTTATKLSTTTGDAPTYACRAWVNFNGQTNPPTIRNSGNVLSITDHGAGDYTVNFSTDMPDENFCAVVTANGATSTVTNLSIGTTAYTNSSVRVLVENASGVNTDSPFVNVAIFR